MAQEALIKSSDKSHITICGQVHAPGRESAVIPR